METKPVITCLKTLLIVYSFVFWVSYRCICSLSAENGRSPFKMRGDEEAEGEEGLERRQHHIDLFNHHRVVPLTAPGL